MGLLSKFFGGASTTPPKQGKPKVVKDGDWEIHVKADGTPSLFYKKGKEWLDSGKAWASPSGRYYFHEGTDAAGDGCIAITTQTEGLRVKKTDEGIEQALVTDAGLAYALSDEGTLYTIAADKASQKALAADASPDAYLLTPDVAAVAVDEGETVTIKAVELATGKAWKKAVAYEWPDGSAGTDVTIQPVEGGIKLTTPAGTAHLFTTAGNPLA